MFHKSTSKRQRRFQQIEISRDINTQEKLLQSTIIGKYLTIILSFHTASTHIIFLVIETEAYSLKHTYISFSFKRYLFIAGMGKVNSYILHGNKGETTIRTHFV